MSVIRMNNSVCPLEYRYGRMEMKNVFSNENRLQRMLDVEASLARAHARVGNIPDKSASEISRKAKISIVKPERVAEIEEKIKHDMMAVVKALTEKCNEAGDYVHLGATSNDIIDTATSLQLRDAIALIETNLNGLIRTLAALSKKYKEVPMVGRTHGQFAVPITFGLKMAWFAAETFRHLERIKECRKRVLVGKMLGAVGTGAALGENALEIQDLVMKDLGLGVEESATQIVGRDRYAEFVLILANIASTLDKFATEIRNLQRSEIMEVAEAFDTKNQVGSSAMPHKQNPMTCENISGLARIVRSFANPALENVVLWHERDLTNSSAERFIIPHTCILIDDMIAKMNNVMSTLMVFPESMKRNIQNSNGFIMAESVMIALVRKGIGRQAAHELVRNCTMIAREKGLSFRDALMVNDDVRRKLSVHELDYALDPSNYLGHSSEIVDRIVRNISRTI